MKTIWFRQLLPVGVMTLAMGFASGVMAAPQGDSSGPAAGTKTTPSAAVQKQQSSEKGNSAAGAPGVSGKPGAESGEKPGGPGSNGRQSSN